MALAPKAVLCFRPGGVLGKAPHPIVATFLGRFLIGLDELAGALVRATVEGYSPPPGGIVPNATIREWARRA